VVQEQRRTGRVTITDPRMTRFWLPLEEAARFVLRCANRMRGGEVFIPKVRSARITDLIAAIAPDCAVEPIGRRPGEKLHEVLLSEDEAPYAVEEDGMYVLRLWEALVRGRRSAISRYASDTAEPLTADELRRLVEARRKDGRPRRSRSHPRARSEHLPRVSRSTRGTPGARAAAATDSGH
jgi:UDP-N-acetylglucosamine 4,6-dehydratase